MTSHIDIDFDVYSDTPPGKDPDSHSPTLRRYHQILWSRQLPNGQALRLTVDEPGAYLYHSSRLGEFYLSSDAITHSYRAVKAMSHIIEQLPDQELDEFFAHCSTPGAYTIFPSKKIDRKPTINGARGLNAKIKDRFDLTLECIRRHYGGDDSPLGDTLKRYAPFFTLFGSFKGYVDFFLLNDLTSADYREVDFWLPFRGFDRSPLPSDLREYREYKSRVISFIDGRNKRISDLNL